MDLGFAYETLLALLSGVPLTLGLAAASVAAGAVMAVILALMRLSGIGVLDWASRAYVFIFRGSPLLVQMFLIYYGLGQFEWVRDSILWPMLRQPFWCALMALTLNTAAYGAEIIRGGLQSVPKGQIDAAKACGMAPWLMFRRIVFPIAIRQALPAYGNEAIAMVKATALASIITMMEITGIAYKLISQTYRGVEILTCAGLIYLAINFILVRGVALLEQRLLAHQCISPMPALPLETLHA
jgi:octopine/nopaline transport system permease protein